MVWVVEGCFAGSEEPYRKLLKPGQRYLFGRKAPADLTLDMKTISRDAGHIDVGPWEPPMLKQSSAPALTATSLAASSQLACSFSSTFAGATQTATQTAILRRPYVRAKAGKKGFNIVHSKDREAYEKNSTSFIGTAVEPNTDFELSDGDMILLVRQAPPITLIWVPLAICVSARGADEVLLREQSRDLAFLSIPLVLSKSFVAGCTHLVAPTADATPQTLEALVALAHIVGPGYVAELVRRGELDKEEEESLENRFVPPDEAVVFPSTTQSEGTSIDEMRSAVVPNEARKSLLQGFTFLVATTNEQVLKQIGRTQHIYEAIGAEVETCPPATLDLYEDERAALRFLQGKQSSTTSKLVIIAQAGSDGEEVWHQIFCKVSRQLRIPMPESGIVALNKALISVTIEGLLDQLAPGADASDVRMDEPNVASTSALPETRKDYGNATGKKERKTPPPPPVTATQTTPSRRLKRRAGLESIDPFAEIFGTADSYPQASYADTQKSATAKRSDATQATQKAATSTKRARDSDVWREVLGADNGNVGPSTNGTTKRADAEPSTKRFRMELEREEMRKTQATQQRGQEQIQEQEEVVDDAEDVAMDAAGDETVRPGDRISSEQEARASRVEGESRQAEVPETIVEKPANTQTGTTTDQKFLQSVASLKRGPKKNLDDFDKEFDRLKLAKPSNSRSQASQSAGKPTLDDRLLDDDDYRAWKEMGEDDFDMRAGGNFVQVDFVPLLRQDETQSSRQETPMQCFLGDETSLSMRYAGRPNFKKFKSKERARRPPIELDLEEMTDYGVSAAYSDFGGKASARSGKAKSLFSGLEEKSSSKATSQATPTQKKSIFDSIALRNDDEDDDEDELTEAPAPRATRSQHPRATQPSGSTQRKGHSRVQTVQSDDDEEENIDLSLDVDLGGVDDSIFNPRPQSSRAKGSASSTQRAGPRSAAAPTQAPRGATQSVIPSKRTAQSRAASNDDDESSDSDQGFSFRGFKRRG